MSQKVIIIGGIGSGTVIAQAIIDSKKNHDTSLSIAGFMSHDKAIGELIEGIPVVAKQSNKNIKLLFEKGYKFIFALHRTDGGEKFVNLFYELGLQPEMLATFIHPTAYVAPDVLIANGSVIMPYVMISAQAKIEMNSLIMVGATIGHNTILRKFSHVASQAVLGAHITMDEGAHIGLNATVREYISIGKFSTLGMGAVLTKNVNEHEIWAGNPAKFLRKTK